MEFSDDVLLFERLIGGMDEHLLKFFYVIFADCQPCSKIMPAKIFQKMGIISKNLQQWKFRNRADRSLSDALIDRDDDRGTVVLLGDSRCDDRNDAGMPFVRVQDEGLVVK